jgi:hypothetical protein
MVNKLGITIRLYSTDSTVEMSGEIQSILRLRKNMKNTDAIGKSKKTNICHESIYTSFVWKRHKRCLLSHSLTSAEEITNYFSRDKLVSAPH